MSAETTSTEVTETEPTVTTSTTDTTATETGQVTEPVVTPPAEPTTETKLPDDHPLVKTLATQKEELKQLRPTAQKVADLESQVAELTPAKEQLTVVQAKYDRLEAFLTSLGGPVSKALDSRSFSTALFESDTDIKDLVAQWHKDNPSATSAALSSGSGTTVSAAADMNAMLRAAAK